MTGVAVLQYGNLRIDPNQRRVYVNEQVVELTTMEFNILYYLALHPGWTFTREQLYQYAMSDVFASGLEVLPTGSTRYGKTKYQCDSNCTRIWLSL